MAKKSVPDEEAVDAGPAEEAKKSNELFADGWLEDEAAVDEELKASKSGACCACWF